MENLLTDAIQRHVNVNCLGYTLKPVSWTDTLTNTEFQTCIQYDFSTFMGIIIIVGLIPKCYMFNLRPPSCSINWCRFVKWRINSYCRQIYNCIPSRFLSTLAKAIIGWNTLWAKINRLINNIQINKQFSSLIMPPEQSIMNDAGYTIHRQKCGRYDIVCTVFPNLDISYFSRRTANAIGNESTKLITPIASVFVLPVKVASETTAETFAIRQTQSEKVRQSVCSSESHQPAQWEIEMIP